MDFETIRKKLKERNNDSLVVVDAINDLSYYYSDFSSDVLNLAELMRNLNEQEIIIRENNTYELLIAFFAAIFSKKTIIPIDPEKENHEVNIIRSIHRGSLYLDIGDIKKYTENTPKNDDVLNWDSVDENNIFLVTYTSGSTGEPKGVIHSIKNLFISAYEFAEMMHYSSFTKMGHAMPMTYMAGVLNTIIMPYIMGGTVVILPRFSMTTAFNFWGDVEKYQVNCLWLSPTMLRILNLIDKRAVMKDYFHNVKMTISVGTAPLDRQLREDFENKYEWRIYQSYGLSETLFISTEVIEEAISQHTVGRLLPSVNLEYSQMGEIMIKVPWMFIGYTNVDTSVYMNDDKYISGDLGRLDDDNLIIIGRVKELIVKGGYNINPRDIENVIIDNHLAIDVAIVPICIGGEELVGAYAIGCETKERLNDTIVKKMGKHNKIDIIELVDNIPKNINGKVDKMMIARELEKKYGSKG